MKRLLCLLVAVALAAAGCGPQSQPTEGICVGKRTVDTAPSPMMVGDVTVWVGGHDTGYQIKMAVLRNGAWRGYWVDVSKADFDRATNGMWVEIRGGAR